MRITVDLDQDVLRVARHLAQEREESLGRVLSDLVRRGLQPTGKVTTHRGTIPVLRRDSAARPVTATVVNELLEND